MNSRVAGDRAGAKETKMPVTIQYEITIARRGSLTTTVKERRFPTQHAFEQWAEKNAGNVTVLRYLAEESY